MPRLENWFIETCDNKEVLYGNIYEDEKGRFPEGAFVHTSYIIDINFEENYCQPKILNIF